MPNLKFKLCIVRAPQRDVKRLCSSLSLTAIRPYIRRGFQHAPVLNAETYCGFEHQQKHASPHHRVIRLAQPQLTAFRLSLGFRELLSCSYFLLHRWQHYEKRTTPPRLASKDAAKTPHTCHINPHVGTNTAHKQTFPTRRNNTS